MKKKIFSTVLLSSFFVAAFAQNDGNSSSNDDSYQPIRIGVYGAPTLSSMRPSAAKDGVKTQENGGSKIGFTYGLMGDFHFSENFR